MTRIPQILRTMVAGFVLAMSLGVSPSVAVQPDEVLSDASLEQRARAISHDLRCLVCQNQSIDDSDAPLAKDLRVLVRERLVAGDSDSQVREFLVARFGEFVMLKPPFKTSTLLLWLTPLVLLIGGFVLAARSMRSRVSSVTSAPLSREEERALAEALKQRDA